MTSELEIGHVLADVAARHVLAEAGFVEATAPFGAPGDLMALWAHDGTLLFAWPEFAPELSGYVVGRIPFDASTSWCRIGESAPRGAALETLARAWRRLQPDQPPPARWVGHTSVWANHLQALDRLNPGLPHMSVDGAFMAAAVRRIRGHLKKSPDARLWIHKQQRQCVLWACGAEFCVPAFGIWHGVAECSAADLLGALPQRMPKWVHLVMEPSLLVVDGEATILCDWLEPAAGAL